MLATTGIGCARPAVDSKGCKPKTERCSQGSASCLLAKVLDMKILRLYNFLIVKYFTEGKKVMSRTQVRNGAEVQRAFHQLSAGREDGVNRFVTVGQVAIEAGCSRPTALKYLKILQQYGIGRGEQLYNRQWLWVWGS